MLAAIESDSITSDWKYLTNTVTLCNLGLDDGYSDGPDGRKGGAERRPVPIPGFL